MLMMDPKNMLRYSTQDIKFLPYFPNQNIEEVRQRIHAPGNSRKNGHSLIGSHYTHFNTILK